MTRDPNMPPGVRESDVPDPNDDGFRPIDDSDLDAEAVPEAGE